MLKNIGWKFVVLAIGMLGFMVATPLMAADYVPSDIALTPGGDASGLKLAWTITGDDTECVVQIAKKSTGIEKLSALFTGTVAESDVDDDGDGVADYSYCEVTVTGLKNQTEYVYRLGDNEGNWSYVYEYSTQNRNAYGFFFVADSQIGASAGDFSRSKDGLPYIVEAYLVREYGLTDENYIEELVDAYSDEELNATNYSALADIDNVVAEIGTLYDLFYDEFSEEGMETDLADLSAEDPEIAEGLLALIAEAAAEQLADTDADAAGWAETVAMMGEQFPEAAFILSGGDQVENASEYEWDGFFSAPELASLPVAPAIGSHDAGYSFGYHWSLPNESLVYGADKSGGDYYYTYGNVLVMVLNMDETMNLYPREDPPPPPDGGGGSPPPGPPPGEGCEGIDDDATFVAGLDYDALDDFIASIEAHDAFMAEAIAANPDARWKVVMWHYSIYSAGRHGSEDVIRSMRYFMVPVLDNLDIDLVLMAHDHAYTRTYQMFDDDPQTEQMVSNKGEIVNPTGTLYITGSSSSGSKYYGLNECYDDDDETTDPDPYYEFVGFAAATKVPTFSYLNVDANSLKITTYWTDTLEVLDTYTIIKADEELEE